MVSCCYKSPRIKSIDLLQVLLRIRPSSALLVERSNLYGTSY